VNPKTETDFTKRGVHVGDVESYLDACSGTFGKLAAVLRMIEREAPKHSDARKLAGAGLKIAADYANLADCWREEVARAGVYNDLR
jgi:hypothetical protein